MEKEKFLANKSVDHGTDASAADAVRRVVFEWGLNEKIIALLYNIASVNTGPGSGKHIFIQLQVTFSSL